MKTKKILSSIAAAVVLSALSFSLFSCNIHRYEKPEADVPGANTVLAGGMQVGEIKASGIQLLSTTVEPVADAENTVEITAKIEPSDAVNQKVDWSIAWTSRGVPLPCAAVLGVLPLAPG